VSQRVAAEALGTALLLAIVVGSGIMGERLAAGNAAIVLLVNSLATVAGLFVLIEVLAPISGAHLNPAVSLVMALRGELSAGEFVLYVAAQLGGALLGTWLAHAMFDLAIWQTSLRARSGAGQWLAEAVASTGLVFVVLRAPAARVGALVACYIGAAYWFTASTSFANPAAVVGRMLSDTFAGIAPAHAPAFVAGQLAGALAGLALHRALGAADTD
jgi:glycerol uptake facilitator-like aquaporin